MQITSSQNPTTLSGINQVSPQDQPEKSARTPTASKSDNSLTVAISAEAQALQKEAAAKKAESAQKGDNERAMQQQAQQQLQNQRPAAKSQRIDITI